MAVHVSTLKHPWLWWEFLTYGFAHSPYDYTHILFNMMGLYFLGRDVEDAYGPKEFLRFYLAAMVFASVVWCVVNRLTGAPGGAIAYGASGAIAGVVILYALNFPHRMLLLFFVIPVPAWLCGVLIVVLDMLGASGHGLEVSGHGGEKVQIAYSMHLAGAAFAAIYYQCGWNFARLTSWWTAWPSFFRRKPALRVHHPNDATLDDLGEQVDRILEKISREGEASLTAKERQMLETASRAYQHRVGRGSDFGKKDDV
jgi:membrane associated rhomboid family serine protease